MQLVAGAVAKSAPLYQYDYGQTLRLYGVELPDVYEVHFGRADVGTSRTMLGGADGVEIPNELLQTGAPINVWVYLHVGEEDGETEFRGQIPVLRRARPVDTAMTPEQRTFVEQAIVTLNAAVESTSEDAAAAEAAAEAAEGSAEDAEAWAIGKRGGVDVPSTDPTYHNNAKFYDGEANTAAWNANACVRLSQTAQGKAETAQAAAETAQAAAEAAQEAAATSESNALISKNAAALSASNANTAKNDAVTAKNNAASSASAASSAARDASNSKSSAANSASNAASAKTAAQAAQAAAESAETAAAASATAASGSATAAAGSATEAAASATAAAASAASVSTATVAETQAMINDYYGG